MACFIRQIKLQRIESRIQQSVYRVDRKKCMEDSEIDAFLQELADWRAMMPRDTYKRSKSEYMAFGNDLTVCPESVVSSQSGNMGIDHGANAQPRWWLTTKLYDCYYTRNCSLTIST